MTTGRLLHNDLQHKPLGAPRALPCINKEARDAFSCGWRNGIAVGIAIGVTLGMVLAGAIK
jgi:hypothetical protein